MYSTCIFCRHPLGRNDAVELFSVGRRLAFDSAKGRLWVVCRECERWNLTPLEERWEAVEECERAFRASKLRVSTEHIGLARLAEGTELVRIGEPQRPEMAAWRYGDQFARRTRRAVAFGIGGMVAIAGVAWGGAALGLYASGAMTGLNVAFQGGMQWMRRRRTIAQVHVGANYLALAQLHVWRTALTPDGAEGWSLNVPFLSPGEQLVYTMNGLRHLTESVTLTGREARRAAAQILPHLNTTAVSARTVREAVHVLEESGASEGIFAKAARVEWKARWGAEWRGKPTAGLLASLPIPLRLALEMAAHEENERRALDGELHLLEAAWRDAEEIAGIADDMFLPASVGDDLARLKRQRGGE